MLRQAERPRETLAPAPSDREAKRNVSPHGGGILASRAVRPVRGCLWADVPPVKWPMGQSPDAPSQSKVDGTVAQCAVSSVSAMLPSTSLGPPSETSSFPCKELRPAERPREASAVEVAFLLMFPRSNGQWVSRPMPRRNQRLTVRSPNAPSPSVSATLPSTSSGPPSETSSFSCKEPRQAERPREASAVEVAFLPASAREVSRARTATPSIPPSACMATTRDAATAAGGKLTR